MNEACFKPEDFVSGCIVHPMPLPDHRSELFPLSPLSPLLFKITDKDQRVESSTGLLQWTPEPGAWV